MMKRLFGIFIAMLAFLMFLSTACEVDEGGSDTEQTDWLVRAEIENSVFKPTELETAIDGLVAVLNETDKNSALKLSFVTKDFGAISLAMIEGANDAFSDLGLVYQVLSPIPQGGVTETDAFIALQKQYLEQLMTQGYNGIALASMSSELVPYIDDAVIQDMTVITVDSDEPASKRQLYVGTINSEAGKQAGATMLELLDGETGTVVVLGNTNTEWQGGIDRTDGAVDALSAAGNTVVVVNTDWEQQDETEAALQAQMEAAGDAMVGCMGVFNTSFMCATAAEKTGIIDDIKVAAFDFEATTLSLMEQGKIQATHGQRLYYNGYFVPFLLYAVETIGLSATQTALSSIMVDEQRINTGLDVVYASQLDVYNQYLADLGIQ